VLIAFSSYDTLTAGTGTNQLLVGYGDSDTLQQSGANQTAVPAGEPRSSHDV
jgi:hypothetical protein